MNVYELFKKKKELEELEQYYLDTGLKILLKADEEEFIQYVSHLTKAVVKNFYIFGTNTENWPQTILKDIMAPNLIDCTTIEIYTSGASDFKIECQCDSTCNLELYHYFFEKNFRCSEFSAFRTFTGYNISITYNLENPQHLIINFYDFDVFIQEDENEYLEKLDSKISYSRRLELANQAITSFFKTEFNDETLSITYSEKNSERELRISLQNWTIDF